MPKATGINLPAYTTIDNILLLLDTLKLKRKDDEAKTIFGKGDSVYTNTKSALRAFGFVENDSLEFTETGRQIAYSPDQEKKRHLTSVFRICTPYEIFLLRLLKNDTITVTTLDDIVNVWGQANYGSTERNRQDAAKLFMSIIQYVEFGKYIIGRGQNSTRIEWAADIKNKIKDISSGAASEFPGGLENVEINTNGESLNATPENVVDDELAKEGTYPKMETPSCTSAHLRIATQPNITINVDMSDWTEEKIKTFFKCAYGQFEGE